MTTCPRCPKTWSGLKASHCPVCHETFSADSNGDRHRKGSHTNDTRHCVNPADVGLILNARGHWSMPGPEQDFREASA